MPGEKLKCYQMTSGNAELDTPKKENFRIQNQRLYMSKKEQLVFSILLSLPHLSPFFVFYNKELGGGGGVGLRADLFTVLLQPPTLVHTTVTLAKTSACGA